MKRQTRLALRLTCILIAALAPAAATAQSLPTAAEVLARVRGAVGFGRLHSQSDGVAVEGTARYRGLDTKFSLLFTPDGRFRTEVAGPLGGVVGFDGAAGWEVDSTGMPRTLEFQDLELAQLDAWVYSSRDPARYKLEGAGWQELYFSGRIPAVRARFEGDREGLFRLDTGSGWTVSFHAPAVESLKLLAGRETRESHSGGVGGSASSRAGRLAWFELGGRRFEGVEVEFTGVREGAFSDVYTMGNIGAGLLREFRVIFDYGNKRAAFARLNAEPTKAPTSGAVTTRPGR